MANKIEEIRQTIAMINAEQVKEILEIIQKARMVHFVAVGNTIPVILDGAYKFNQIGITAVANTVWENQLAFACNLTKEDVVIAVSSSGASKKLLTLIDLAHQKEATTICITNHEHSPLAHKCQYQISAATRERLFLDEYAFSRVSTMVVIEALFLLLTADKKDAYQCMSKHEQSMADDKL